MSETIVSTPPKTSLGLLTYEDYLTFPDVDGITKEIIEGELFMSPAPALKHQIISKELFLILNNFVRKHRLGEVFYAPCDVVFSNINVMQPDILFISKNNFHILTELNIKGAPDLIVEIISPSSKDTDCIYKKMYTKNLVLKNIGSSIQMKKLLKSGRRRIKIFSLIVELQKTRKLKVSC